MLEYFIDDFKSTKYFLPGSIIINLQPSSSITIASL